MSSLPTPQAKRLVPPSWKDTRLVVGVLLVLSSVVLGGLAFRAVDDRRGMWVAKAEMVPGDVVTEEDLVRVEAQLGTDTAAYLRTSEQLPAGAVVDRPIQAGELVPRSALVDPGSLEVRRVAVHVDPIYLTNLAKGSRVSVYAVGEPASTSRATSGTVSTVAGGSSPADYELVLERVTVQELPQRTGAVMGSGVAGSSVVLLVPESEVARLLSLDRKDAPIKLVAEGAAQGTGEGAEG